MHHRGGEDGDEEHWVLEEHGRVRESTIPSTKDWYLISTRDIEMQRTIMKAQLDGEEAARSVAGGGAVRVVLSDRSAIDPLAYAVSTAANEGEARERMRVLVDTPEFQTALHRYREGTFILFKPVQGWLVDDGVRSMEKQDRTLEVFRGILKELGIPYVELGEEIKDLQARVTFAMKLLNQNGTNVFLLENRVIMLISRRGETVTAIRFHTRN